MEKQFVTYEIALVLKELGFNKECFTYYIGNEDIKFHYNGYGNVINKRQISDKFAQITSAPLWQQVIDWLREKHDIDVEIHSSFGSGGWWWANLCCNPTRTEVLNIARFENYYEARKQAILKAIELIQDGNN